MTTIVYRDGVLVGDTAVFDRGTYCGETNKIFETPDGTIFGFCGMLGDMVRLRQWMEAGELGERPAFSEQASEAIIIRPNGRVWWHGKDDDVELKGEYFAIGTGFQIAMGALAAGATAERAVEIAADLDQLTRRPLKMIRLKQKLEAVA